MCSGQVRSPRRRRPVRPRRKPSDGSSTPAPKNRRDVPPPRQEHTLIWMGRKGGDVSAQAAPACRKLRKVGDGAQRPRDASHASKAGCTEKPIISAHLNVVHSIQLIRNSRQTWLPWPTYVLRATDWWDDFYAINVLEVGRWRDRVIMRQGCVERCKIPPRRFSVGRR